MLTPKQFDALLKSRKGLALEAYFDLVYPVNESAAELRIRALMLDCGRHTPMCEITDQALSEQYAYESSLVIDLVPAAKKVFRLGSMAYSFTDGDGHATDHAVQVAEYVPGDCNPVEAMRPVLVRQARARHGYCPAFRISPRSIEVT